jgi:hypothetical protein
MGKIRKQQGKSNLDKSSHYLPSIKPSLPEFPPPSEGFKLTKSFGASKPKWRTAGNLNTLSLEDEAEWLQNRTFYQENSHSHSAWSLIPDESYASVQTSDFILPNNCSLIEAAQEPAFQNAVHESRKKIINSTVNLYNFLFSQSFIEL